MIPKIGDVVYPHCTPVKVGVVIEVRNTFENGFRVDDGRPYTLHKIEVDIIDLKGRIHTYNELEIKNYRQLYEDHKRKAEKMRNTLTDLDIIFCQHQKEKGGDSV